MLIDNATLVTLDAEGRVIENGALLIREGRIADLGERTTLRARYPDEREVFDAGGKVMLPGAICAHTHFYGAFARGLAIPGSLRATLSRCCKSCGGDSIARSTLRA